MCLLLLFPGRVSPPSLLPIYCVCCTARRAQSACWLVRAWGFSHPGTPQISHCSPPLEPSTPHIRTRPPTPTTTSSTASTTGSGHPPPSLPPSLRPQHTPTTNCHPPTTNHQPPWASVSCPQWTGAGLPLAPTPSSCGMTAARGAPCWAWSRSRGAARAPGSAARPSWSRCG